jgi:hypothetical protein
MAELGGFGAVDPALIAKERDKLGGAAQMLIKSLQNTGKRSHNNRARFYKSLLGLRIDLQKGESDR